MRWVKAKKSIIRIDQLENFKCSTFEYINRIYVVWPVPFFPSHISSIDTHMGIETVNPIHMFVVLSNAVKPIDFYVISLARVPTFHLCVRQICMYIRKNCYRSIVIPCHTRYTTSLLVHLHSSVFFAFDVFFCWFSNLFQDELLWLFRLLSLHAPLELI